jgi:hypothetical protein
MSYSGRSSEGSSRPSADHGPQMRALADAGFTTVERLGVGGTLALHLTERP